VEDKVSDLPGQLHPWEELENEKDYINDYDNDREKAESYLRFI